MIVKILLLLLFIIVASAMLFFLFSILFPSLKAQKVNAKDPLFSKEEVEFKTGSPEFRHQETGMKAVVLCSPERNVEEKRFSYQGQRDCTLFKSIYGTENFCNYGCPGFGNCVKACTRQAITIQNQTAVVNSACNGCGLCVTVCPKKLIVLVPITSQECMNCKCPEDEKNNCTMCGKKMSQKINMQKDYEFWKKCYKMFKRN
jgi:ferredoxin